MTDWDEHMAEADRLARANGAEPWWPYNCVRTAPEVRTPSRWPPASRWQDIPIPPREWHVADLIPAKTVTMLGGDGGTGKSLLAMQLAAATVLGRLWLRREVRAGGALYLSAEDDEDELHRRLAAILDAEGASFDALDRLAVRSLAGKDALLAIPDPKTGVLHATDLFEDLDATIGASRPALVVLDTLADLHAGEENNRSWARQFIGVIRGIAIRHECSVVLLAHPSLTGMASGSGLSGSTAWNASVRSRLYLDRVQEEGYEPDPDRRVLRTVKSNYGRTGGELAMTWRNGVFVADEAETSLDRMAAGAKGERVFLKLLDLFAEEGRNVSHTSGKNYAPFLFSKDPRVEGVGKRPLEAAMNALFAAGKLRVEDYGAASQGRKRLAKVVS